MIRFLTHNAGWKVLSLIIATAIWASVASEPELATFVSVRVEYKDLPQDLVISSNVVESVYLELRGPSGSLRNFAESGGAAVVLDMSGVRSGEQTFTVGEDNVSLPRGLRLIRAIPSQIRFDFERVLVRTVPVEVRFAQPPPRGYRLASYGVDPPKLIVRGPESRVSKLKTATTDPLDLSGVVATAEFRVNAFIGDPEVQLVSAPEVVVSVTVKKE